MPEPVVIMEAAVKQLKRIADSLEPIAKFARVQIATHSKMITPIKDMLEMMNEQSKDDQHPGVQSVLRILEAFK